MHADMNSYFASVEQQANPFLRGKPVAICSRISRNACIIACSVEAKKLGIKTGFSLNEAKVIAPNIIALEVDPPKVRTVTKKIFTIFADFTSAIEPYSIDEAFMDVTGYVNSFEAAHEMALVIKKRIRNEVGEWLGCSIGISYTRWLAKFAGELQKPDGLTILKKEDLARIYKNRPVDEAWGIAKGWKTRLNALGINTLGELLVYNPLELKRRFGMPGYIIWANVSGLDIKEVKTATNEQQKSIGHSYVFHKRTADEQMISAIAMKLCERVGCRLRKLGMETRGIRVDWSCGENGDSRRVRCFDSVFESYDIYNAAFKTFRNAWNRSVVTFMGITAFDLVPTNGQISIFNNKQKKRGLSTALDLVNDRYGAYTVFRGQMWGTEESAPDRVGFRQTVPVPAFIN